MHLLLENGCNLRKKHNGRLVLGRALQVVQDSMRTNIWKHFTNSGKKQYIKGRLGHFLGDGRDKVCLGIKNTLEKLFELFFIHRFFCLNNSIPDVTALQEFNGQIIEVDIQNTDSMLFKFVDQLDTKLFHFPGSLGGKGTDEKGNFIAKPLFLQKTITADEFQEMIIGFLN